MPTRTISVDGRAWRVMPVGRVTQYDRDEFSLFFITGTGEHAETRVTRFTPTGTRAREAALAELSDADLSRLFRSSAPSEMSPEAGYAP